MSVSKSSLELGYKCQMDSLHSVTGLKQSVFEANLNVIQAIGPIRLQAAQQSELCVVRQFQ